MQKYILNTCLEGQICNQLNASGFYDLLLKLNRVDIKICSYTKAYLLQACFILGMWVLRTTVVPVADRSFQELPEDLEDDAYMNSFVQ